MNRYPKSCLSLFLSALLFGASATADQPRIKVYKSPSCGCCTKWVSHLQEHVIEGHVPADDIKRLLAERPDVKGLSAPGMPEGSPGMETGRHPPYQVLSFDAQGKTRVFAEH